VALPIYKTQFGNRKYTNL